MLCSRPQCRRYQLDTPALRKSLNKDEVEFVVLINRYRREHGIIPLQLLPTLTLAARHHSADMAEEGYNFDHSHMLSDGTTCHKNMHNHGYPDTTSTGENLAGGLEKGSDVFIGWKNSPGHNAIMLEPEFHALGVSRVQSTDPKSRYRWFWTATFGSHIYPEIDWTVNPRVTSEFRAWQRSQVEWELGAGEWVMKDLQVPEPSKEWWVSCVLRDSFLCYG